MAKSEGLGSSFSSSKLAVGVVKVNSKSAREGIPGLAALTSSALMRVLKFHRRATEVKAVLKAFQEEVPRRMTLEEVGLITCCILT